MITYPVIFFGAGNGPLKEDFNDYPVGEVVSHDQIWQHYCNQWLVPKNPTKYVGVIWKDYGVSGAFDDFSSYDFGEFSVSDILNLKGEGNFERPFNGFSVGYYREPNGGFVSSDTVRGIDYINFDWGAEPPVEGFKQDFWSAKFVGKLNLPIDGTYKFYVERDDSCRIYVGREDGPNLLVFDKWGVTPPGTLEAGYNFTFSAGLIDVLIHFYDNAGDSKLKLYWSTPIVSGGQPATPPTVILPSDFGNSGYLRVFSLLGANTSIANQSFDFDGMYQLGIPWGELVYQDGAVSQFDVSGSYRLGISYSDYSRGSSKEEVSHAGYYVQRGLGVNGVDFARTSINDAGFYSYRSANAMDKDAASVSISPLNSFYAYRSPTVRQKHSTRENLKSAGFYAFGRVYFDQKADFAQTSLNANGFHALRFVHGREKDSAKFIADIYGNYFPVHVHATAEDFARNHLKPSGYYISGYVNDDNIDYAKNSVRFAGHRAYWMVTGDKVLESTIARNSLGISYGNYFYRNVSQYEREYVFGDLNTYGVYIPRYCYDVEREENFNSLDPHGIYYNIRAYTRPTEPSFNQIIPAGYFTYGYDSFYTREMSKTILHPVGHYVSGYIPLQYKEVDYNKINADGNYSFGVNFMRGKNSSRNTLKTQGLYFCIYSPQEYSDLSSSSLSHSGSYYWRYKPNYAGREYVRENMFVNGEYAIRFFPYKFGMDFGAEQINARGLYITGRVNQSSLDISRSTLSSAGNYFNRFASSSSIDIAKTSQFLDGSYLYRILTSESLSADISRTQLGYAGRYYPLRAQTHQTDTLSANLKLAGLYLGIYSKNSYTEPAKFDITFGGEIVSRFVPRNDVDSILTDIGFSEAFYTSRFVPTDISTVNANSFVLFDGEYSRESWILADSTVFEIDFASEFVSFYEKGDYATTSTDISGSFVAAKVSTTMDYWLEIYKNPTYNMGKTQAYFSI